MRILINTGLNAMRYFLVACMACITLLVFSNVVMRYIFSSSIYIAEGLSSLIFVWLTFVGAALVLYEGGLISVDVLVNRLPEFYKKACKLLVEVLILGVALLLFKGSWSQMTLNMNITSSSTLLPAAFLYAPGVFFAFLSGSFIIYRLLGRVALIILKKSPLSDLKY